jgi:DMSO reductase anchor subunit
MSARAGHGPLVAFTSLAIAGAGLVAASAYFELVHGAAGAGATAAGAILVAAGLTVSIDHLGQKSRAALAVRGVGRSALSNEALLAGLALGAAAIAAAAGLSGVRAAPLVAGAGAANAAFLVSIGLVYRVPGQLTWRGFSAVTPLTGGLAFGAIAVQATAAAGGVHPGTLLFIAVDALLFSQRWRDIAGIAYSERMLADPWHVRRTPLLAARFFLLNVVPFFLLLGAGTPLAIPVAAAGLAVDRFGFYALALQQTTEYEIGAVEARITAAGPMPQD